MSVKMIKSLHLLHLKLLVICHISTFFPQACNTTTLELQVFDWQQWTHFQCFSLLHNLIIILRKSSESHLCVIFSETVHQETVTKYNQQDFCKIAMSLTLNTEAHILFVFLLFKHPQQEGILTALYISFSSTSCN